jgi:cytochrome oxidase Cu insertion factor (SCO1/SenC/PrrC family)
MNRGFVVRLLLMLGLAALLAVRMGLVGRRSYGRGSAGVSSGEYGGGEHVAAGRAPAATGALLTSIAGRLTDASGRTRTLAEFRGAPFVASLVYTRCTSVCPRLVAGLQRFERESGGGAPPRFVLFSLDPSHDTPAALRAFASTHALDSTRWTLLVPEPGVLPPLASALGVAWQPTPDGGIAHSAVVAMVDRAGRVRSRQIGLSNDPARLAAAWRAVQ